MDRAIITERGTSIEEIVLMVANAAVLGLLLLLNPASDSCVALRSAHDNLLRSSFTLQRQLTVTMNGAVKMRETSRLDYRDGTLAIERLEVDLLDDNLVLEESGNDPALETSVRCDDVKDLGRGRYSISSTDGKEQQELELILDVDRQVLLPAVWRSRERARFLWKKFLIETEVIYSGFERQE